MPTLWKPWRRRRSKQPQAPVSSSTAESGSIDLPPSLQEVNDDVEVVHKEGEGIVFLVVIQEHKPSAVDEVTVRAGLVVQLLYKDGTWLYVRDIEGHSGYVPASACCTMEQLREEHWKASSSDQHNRKPLPKRHGVHDLARPSSNLNCDTQPSTPAIVHLTADLQSSSQSPCSPASSNSNRRGDPHNRLVEIEILERPPPRSTVQSAPPQTFHPLHPLSFSKRMDKTGDHRKRNSPVSPHIQRHLDCSAPHNRNSSYQEAVSVTDETDGATGMTRPRPSHLPLSKGLAYDHLNRYQLDTVNRHKTLEALHTSSHESQCGEDDVFFPTVRKPLGIYRVIGNYLKAVPGEATVRKNEYVIAAGIGVGEWASIITSTGIEGLVPKSVLQRYAPNHCCTVSTQTELVIVAPSASSFSNAGHKGLFSVQEVPLPSRQRRRRRRREQHQAIQTDCALESLAYRQPQAWSNSNTLENSFWYENSISIPQLSTCRNPLPNGSSHTLESINDEEPFAPPNFSSSPHTLPHLQPPPSRCPPQASLPALLLDSLSSVSLTSSEEEAMPNKRAAPGRRKTQQSPTPEACVADSHSPHSVVLTAVRDFIPTSNQRKMLYLKRGDHVQLTPGSTKLQDGWLWAYHKSRHLYGYVPKSHMAHLHFNPYKHSGSPSSVNEATTV